MEKHEHIHGSKNVCPKENTASWTEKHQVEFPKVPYLALLYL